ncbi:hypothetical protein [Streptomyces sp. 3214.6]|uniref:hypothetical protein n=1 Tax=Streptomyces sp. 3214.6 TaxID=1882757 RepID=UPI00090CBCA4|nr:hypothetical protein [Streptomyces sp. 3214.6]SHH84884.1 hypothetical protein SAMN05444521_2215 [Streptomyces sp. 3214.6]
MRRSQALRREHKSASVPNSPEESRAPGPPPAASGLRYSFANTEVAPRTQIATVAPPTGAPSGGAPGGLGTGLTPGTKVVRLDEAGDSTHWEIVATDRFGRYRIKNTLEEGITGGVPQIVSSSSRAWATEANAAASRSAFLAEQAKEQAEKQKNDDLAQGGIYLSSGYRQINSLLAAFEKTGYTPAQVRDANFNFSGRANLVLETWKQVATERRYATREETESWDMQDLDKWHDKIKAIHRVWDAFKKDPEIPGNTVVRGDSEQIFSSFGGILDPARYPKGGYYDLGRTISWPGILSTTMGIATTHNFVKSKTVIWKFDVSEQGHPGRVLGSENQAEAEVTFPVSTRIKIKRVLVRNGRFAQELTGEFGDKAKVIVFADILALDEFGGPPSERYPLHSIPENDPLDGAATDLPGIE